MLYLEGGITYDVTIRQGDTWQLALQLVDASDKPIALANYTGRFQIRPTAASSTITVSLTTTTTADGSVAIDSTGGVTVTITDEKTATIAAGMYEYDLFLDSAAGVSNCVAKGLVKVEARVTR